MLTYALGGGELLLPHAQFCVVAREALEFLEVFVGQGLTDWREVQRRGRKARTAKRLAVRMVSTDG